MPICFSEKKQDVWFPLNIFFIIIVALTYTYVFVHIFRVDFEHGSTPPYLLTPFFLPEENRRRRTEPRSLAGQVGAHLALCLLMLLTF